MSTIKISATKARNNFFELLNQVALGKQVIIEKDKKEVAILSAKIQKFNWKEFKKSAAKAKGILKNADFDPKNNPLRRPGAADFLGRWDKDWQEKR